MLLSATKKLENLSQHSTCGIRKHWKKGLDLLDTPHSVLLDWSQGGLQSGQTLETHSFYLSFLSRLLNFRLPLLYRRPTVTSTNMQLVFQIVGCHPMLLLRVGKPCYKTRLDILWKLVGSHMHLTGFSH